MSVKSCGTPLDAIFLVFSKSFRMWRTVECASLVTCCNSRIVRFRSTSCNADTSCTFSSLTGGWPDWGMCSTRSRPSRKAATHLATVLYGNAAASHVSCNPRWRCLAVWPLAHWIFIYVLWSCLENIATVFCEPWLPTTHLTGATVHKRWWGRARSLLWGRGCRSATFGKSGSTEALVPKLKKPTHVLIISVHSSSS